MSFGIEIEFEYPGANAFLGQINQGLSQWAILSDDQSLRGEGGEIITLQLTHRAAAEFLQAVDVVFNETLQVPRTATASQNSAIHVHFSLNEDRNWHRTPGLIRSQIWAGVVVEDILLALHPSRFGGNFCVPETVSKIGYLLATILPTLPNRRDVAAFIRDNAEKYSAVNFLPLGTTSSSEANIEYRMFPSDISTEQLLLAMNIMSGIHGAFLGQTELSYSAALRSLAGSEAPTDCISVEALVVGSLGEYPGEDISQRRFNNLVDRYYRDLDHHPALVRFLSRVYLAAVNNQQHLPVDAHFSFLSLILENMHRQAKNPNFRARMWAMGA